MNSPDASIPEVIRRLKRKGVKLWVEHDSIHYNAPLGSITQDEKAALRYAKHSAIEIINLTNIDDSTNRLARAPLSFTQEAHWNLYRLHERPSLRQIASAVRLRGRLDVEALQQSLRDVVLRHDALRSQIVVQNGAPEQEVSASAVARLEIEDFSNLRESVRQIAIVDRIAEHVLEPVHLCIDPLLAGILIRAHELEHTLVLSMEHMISDAVSMNILLRDLLAAYERVSKGAVSVPTPVPLQFPEYANWLRKTQDRRQKAHGHYWNSHLLKSQYTPFPRDQNLPLEAVPAWDTSPIRIRRDLILDLRKWSKQHQTTLVFCFLTAYIALLSCWCNTSSTIVQYLSNGRQSTALENTIGYFATPLFIRVETPGTIRFSELLRAVTAEYCDAVENADYSYLEARTPRPAVCRACIFNWVPQGPNYDRHAWAQSSTGMACESVEFGQPMLKRFGRDNDPGLTLFDTGEAVVGGLYFPVCRFSRSTMDRFGKELLALLEDILKHCDPRIVDIIA